MIYTILANGFEETEAICPLDLLRRAGFDARTVGLTGKAVTGAHGITVLADLTAEEADFSACDLLILPGGMPGTLNLDRSAVVDRALRTVAERGGRLAAICAAPSVLGHRGYLRGKTAVCFPGFEEELDGATLSDRAVVTDGKITTGKGMEWSLEFGKELVRVMQKNN